MGFRILSLPITFFDVYRDFLVELIHGQIAEFQETAANLA